MPVINFRRWLNLSIFGRTFFLIMAALCISEGFGLLLATRFIVQIPPSVSVENIAARLSGAQNFDRPPFNDFNRSSPPPLPPFDRGAPQQLPNQPPANFSGPPGSRRSDLQIYQTQTAPSAPADIDLDTSHHVQNRLSELLNIDKELLLVFVKTSAHLIRDPMQSDRTRLQQNFVIAKKMDDGGWRVVEFSGDRFPNSLEKHALLMFAFSLLILLPIVWIFARALSIPIAKFSQATRRIGTDPNAPPLPVEGPKEMHAAIESFNAMQERLNGLLRERTEMIAAIAHDLRTPLTRLTFRLDDLPAPLNEKVMADINEMKSMISLALDFIRDRSQGINRQRLDFRLLVESVVDDQVDLGREVVLAKGAPVTLEGDPLALRRAIMNLVDNAIKYGERARLQLTVIDESCVLDIDDDGPGINEALHKRVFEPFYRVEGSRNRDTGGVGLGLAVVRAVIQDHAGEIQLRNRSPKGLRVTIKLPLVIA